MKIEQIINAIDTLTDEEFLMLAKQIDAHRQRRAQAIIAEATQKAEALAGYSLTTGKPKRHVPAKYYDPKTGNTWTGKGRQPNWLESYIKAGKNKEDFLIS